MSDVWTKALATMNPAIDRDGIAHCTREGCPLFSRGRCAIVAGPPETICEPLHALRGAHGAEVFEARRVIVREGAPAAVEPPRCGVCGLAVYRLAEGRCPHCWNVPNIGDMVA